MAPDPSSPTIYFGFGSNLWLHQMATRCPTSTYLGVARLNNHKWIINDRGYANLVEVGPKSTLTPDYSRVVYGLVYSLLPSDESRLDKNEGVPHAYVKELFPCDFWASKDGKKVDVTASPTESGKKMLVYIDRKRRTESTPKEEYVYRMNRGIEDVVKMGAPEAYVEEVLRKFIPVEGKEEKRKSLEEKAKRQLVDFVDENLV
ncbi:uncharacterized protein N0V89_001057 [Didymosphaeria variabile]|uniref:gamma-glutamylcyclotransferase n=1 Tax=Didymosphaeria variabile TaxID=1932322 RepID=A0A9W8XXY6_9PLEO|nr:uncharacterized protein N0V89_001057 [Didymosphaeria variabile]KAJ4360492.1 hypothetical protein N0V89_001057 [Didymosphaeria variabile]